MSVNFFILSRELFDSYCKLYLACINLFDRMDDLEYAIRACRGSMRVPPGSDAAFTKIGIAIVNSFIDHKNHPDAIHIGRRYTNGHFIWNIQSDSLRSLAEGKCIVHEGMFLSDDAKMTVDEFLREHVSNATS